MGLGHVIEHFDLMFVGLKPQVGFHKPNLMKKGGGREWRHHQRGARARARARARASLGPHQT